MPEQSPGTPDEDLTDLLSERISQFDNAVYVAMFLCAILSLLLFAAPAAQHRLMSPLTDRAAFKRLVNRQVIIGLIPLSAALILAAYLVISDVVSALAAAIVAAIVALAIGMLWWVIPLNKRWR